jgi:protein-S-isoprenylcysteine O-methyltransferase Ste14
MSFIPVFKIGLWNAWLFMVVFLLQMVVMMFVGKQVMEKSHVPKEARKNKAERYAGVLGNLIWLIAMVYSVFLPLALGTVWFYTGFFIFVIGLILLIVATQNFITTPADQLIPRGVYRISRHPMYLATFFITLSSGIATASWLFIFLSLILALCLRWEAMIEERFCKNEYSDLYNQYCSRVPRWFGIGGNHDN